MGHAKEMSSHRAIPLAIVTHSLRAPPHLKETLSELFWTRLRITGACDGLWLDLWLDLMLACLPLLGLSSQLQLITRQFSEDVDSIIAAAYSSSDPPLGFLKGRRHPGGRYVLVS